jgi:hypothetical protein
MLAMARSRHSDKDIEAVLIYAEQNNCIIKVGGSHACARCIVPQMIRNVVVVSFALPVYGVRREIQETIPNRFDE